MEQAIIASSDIQAIWESYDMIPMIIIVPSCLEPAQSIAPLLARLFNNDDHSQI